MPADEGLGVLDRLAEQGPGQARAANRRCHGRCGWRGQYASPKKVMASTTPVTMVTPTKARPSPARPPDTRKKASSAQGRLVKGSRPMRSGQRLRATACSSRDGQRELLAPDAHVHARVLGLLHHQASRRPSSAAPTVSARAA